MAHIPDPTGAFTRLAANILRHQGVTVATTVGTVVDFVRPLIVGREQETTGEGTLQGDGERLIVAVANVASPTHLPKCRVRTDTRFRVNDIDFGKSEQMGAFAAYISDRPHKIQRQSLLH